MTNSDNGHQLDHEHQLLNKKKLRAEIWDLRYSTWIKAVATLIIGAVGLYLGNNLVQERLTLQQERLEIEQGMLEIAVRELGEVFSAMIAEPSGLALTCHQTISGSPLLLVVDDEFDMTVLVTPIGETALPVQRLGSGKFGVINDLEAVAAIENGEHCSEWQYIIVTSHRDETDARETKVIRFQIEPDAERPDRFKVTHVVTFSLVHGLAAYLSAAEIFSVQGEPGGRQIEGRPWLESEEKKDEFQKYALEIEAAAQVGDELWVGLKFPLNGENAVLLRYTGADILAADAGNDIAPDAYAFLDLDNHGISAMTVFHDCLFVAANPTSKRSEDYGKSVLHAFTQSQIESGPGPHMHKGFTEGLSVAHAKVEGITVREAGLWGADRLWLTYDPEIDYELAANILRVKTAIPDLLPGIGGHCYPFPVYFMRP